MFRLLFVVVRPFGKGVDGLLLFGDDIAGGLEAFPNVPQLLGEVWIALRKGLNLCVSPSEIVVSAGGGTPRKNYSRTKYAVRIKERKT